MGIYVACVTYILFLAKYWDFSHLKTTILWFLFSAMAIFVRSDNVENRNKFFKEATLDNFKVTAFIEFFANFYVFNKAIELLFIPITALLGASLALAEHDKKYTSATKVLQYAISIVGTIILIYALNQIIKDYSSFFNMDTLKDVTIPITLSISLLPFIYLLLVYIKFETLFVRLPYFINDKKLLNFTKVQLITRIHLKLSVLEHWSRELVTFTLDSKEKIMESITESELKVGSVKA